MPQKESRQRQKLLRMFVDPASISSGWALFQNKRLIASGTVAVDKKLHWSERLHWIRQKYLELPFTNIDEVHIERLVRRTHIITHYSVGVIASVLCLYSKAVSADVGIRSWQKYCEWDNKAAKVALRKAGVTEQDAIKMVKCNRKLVKYKKTVDTLDELEAIAMGVYWVNEEHKR